MSETRSPRSGRKVLFIIIDQLRADCIHGRLADHVNLPNIAALQSEAMSFDAHFSVTNPCGPSRASIFTGLYAMNHRSIRNGTPLDGNRTNVALEARKAGYDPLLYGYSDTTMDPRFFHPMDPQLHSEERVLPGLREMLEMRYLESYPWRAHLVARGYDVPDYSRFYESVSPDPDRPARPDDPPFYRAEDSDTAFLADKVLEDLAVRRHQDWFALVTFLRPHPPFVAPAPYNRMYDPARLPLPIGLPTRQEEAAVHPFMKAALVAPSMVQTVKGCDGQIENGNVEDIQTLRSIYLGLATEVDRHVGRIIDFLKDSGQYDDTLIFLMADHGEMLGDHHMWGKQNPYEAAYRVPLIIRHPDMKDGHGTRTDMFTESVDIMPTILECLGRPVPAGCDGRSLLPLLRGEQPADWRDAVHMELDFGEPDQDTPWQQATGCSLDEANLAILREKRFKLVHFNGGLPPLLFDLETDPDELHDLAADPAHTPQLLRLTRKLLSLRMHHADRTLANVRITPQGAMNFHDGT